MRLRILQGSLISLAVVLGAGGVLLVLGVALTLWVGVEGYFAPYPAIDTRFAPGYSEAGFRSIQVGMTKAEVLQRVGAPFNAVQDQGWMYSQDGACGWWDFAWLMRGVNFDATGRVTDVTTFTAYD